MLTKEMQSLGGQKMSIILRQNALTSYYINPIYCKYCNAIIDVKDNEKVSQIKKKKFCNRICSAKFNNKKKEKVTKIKVEKDIFESWKHRTKGELFNECKNYFSARCTITKFAKRSIKHANIKKICGNCGYDKHVEVCHIKGVAEFDDNATLFDINRIENLIYLCPNCHWEYDNNILIFREGWVSH